MVNFILKSFVNALQLPTKKTKIPIRGMEASRIQSVAIVDIQVDSRVNEFQLKMPFYVLSTVVNELSSCMILKCGWAIPHNHLN